MGQSGEVSPGEIRVVQISNKQLIGTLVSTLGLLALGYYYTISYFAGDLVSELRTEVSEIEARRSTDGIGFENADERLRVILDEQNKTLVRELGRMTSDIVATNQEISNQVGQLRGELTNLFQSSEDRIMQRFDRLEDRLGETIDRMGAAPRIPLSPGIFEINDEGELLDSKGQILGDTPIYIDLYRQ